MPPALQTLDDAQIRALLRELGEAAQSYRFEVAPNPCVGAAVLSRGTVIGRGYHRFWGGRHAEVEALEAAEASGVDRKDWDTLVVTLEPCSSQGKTPRCTDAIRAAGISRVIVGEPDPDPRHQGAGLRALQDAQIEVESFPGNASLDVLSPYFGAWTGSERGHRPRPWTIAKWAQTRSGFLRPPVDVGEGRWISSLASRAEVHVLRSRVDAIVTGVSTVLHDDPRLSVRPPGECDIAPLRVVLDTQLRTPPSARVLAPATDLSERAGQSVVLGAIGVSPSKYSGLLATGAQVEILPTGTNGRVSLAHVQDWLWKAGVRRVLLEAGPVLLSAAFEGNWVDQMRVYTGDVIGGRGEPVGVRPSESDLSAILHREVGNDAVMEGFVSLRGTRRQ